jgi:hypothetical protein
MSTGWNNQRATDAVNRTLKGGSSGRLAVLLLAAGFLALGIYVGNPWLSVPFGIATGLAAWPVVMAGRNDLAARRMSRRRAADRGRDDLDTGSGSVRNGEGRAS